MTTAQIIAAMQFGLGLCLLLMIYKFLYQKTRLDRFREDLFTMRDNLFDYMWKHNLSFDTPAYRKMRRMLNGFILVADRFNVGGFLLGVIFAHEETKGEDFKVYLDSVTDEKFKEYLSDLYRNVARRIARFIFLEGPLWIVFKPLIWAVFHLPALHRWFVNQFAAIANAAANFGSPETKPHRLADAATVS